MSSNKAEKQQPQIGLPVKSAVLTGRAHFVALGINGERTLGEDQVKKYGLKMSWVDGRGLYIERAGRTGMIPAQQVDFVEFE